MLTLPSLNRRHQAGLFLVLVAAGLSLFFEASAKQTAGIIFLGLAATWLFGTVCLRTLGLTLASASCCVGLYLTIPPVWNQLKLSRSDAQAYDEAVLDIRKAVQVEHGPWEDYAEKRTVPIPASVFWYLRPEKEGSEWDAGTISFPRGTTSEEILQAFQRNMIPRPTFSMRAAIQYNLLPSVGGSLLFLLGLSGLILFAWQAFKRKRQVAVPQQPSV